jgi:rare lipoprotein A
VKGEGLKAVNRTLRVPGSSLCIAENYLSARPPGCGKSTLHPSPFTLHGATAILIAVALSGCGTVTTRESSAPAKPAAPRAGGYYLNDGPADNPPSHLEQIPDAVPRVEPLRRSAMRPYTVMEQNYTPMTQLAPYKARGIASWYGRRYHGQQTASGEIYDMYGMTAAHTILPIPSYARVTNLANNKSIVVRINDRGPFRSDRLIDLSYTAAYKLGVLGGGRALVEVETIMPGAQIAGKTPAISTADKTGSGGETGQAANRAPAPDTPVPPVAATQSSTPGPAEGSDQAVASQPLPVAIDASGVYLQLAAFGSQENADSYLIRLRAQIEWLTPALHVYPKDGLFRVHAGPYANQTEARAAADRISQALGIKAMVLTR